MGIISHYQALGVKSNATKYEIRKAYMRLFMKWHPNLNQHDDMKQVVKKFKQISLAYQVLINKTKRRRYNKFLVKRFLGSKLKKERLAKERRINSQYPIRPNRFAFLKMNLSCPRQNFNNRRSVGSQVEPITETSEWYAGPSSWNRITVETWNSSGLVRATHTFAHGGEMFLRVYENGHLVRRAHFRRVQLVRDENGTTANKHRRNNGKKR